jgi:hypothetical protein
VQCVTSITMIGSAVYTTVSTQSAHIIFTKDACLSRPAATRQEKRQEDTIPYCVH